ncbi:Sulfate permease family protein 3 [Meloidogyne graminicola]|uniref:Sulfate permease family protein 3 n=1 Tax=Meloidogyne graminicola TaxID=189291 RepID=A0A8S9ZI54_9BILA|nr:Sulfate permease family protein 3 [Meloidogyne graminicola]
MIPQAEFELKYGHIVRSTQQIKEQKILNSKLEPLINNCKSIGCLKKENIKKVIFKILPILDWLPNYKFKKYLQCDIITGLTVGIMVVPQGMAYATLAKVPPVYGLYSCFFPAFFYMFFGTSPHVSIGTFAVASMMVGNLRSQLIPENGNNNTNALMINGEQLDPLVLTSTLTFGVGIFQLLMAIFQLSFITNYISDSLISGFTTGAAVHVLTSQLDKLIGIKIKSYGGPGLVLFMWRDLLFSTSKINLFTVGISVFGLLFLSIGRDLINPIFKKRFRIPLPLELLLVIAAIILSSLIGLKNNYGVRIVEYVPQGMPNYSIPHFSILKLIWLDALTISIICYAFLYSLGKIFAKKHKYKLNANQELYALSMCSIFSSFFPVFPFGASLSRSSLCELTGAKTQFHALFSSILLLIVILWIGPLLEPLPIAVLGCIVVVSLKPLFLQFKELPRLWKINIFDFLIWLISFLSTAFLNITYGLIISLFFSILSIILQEQWPKFIQIGTLIDPGMKINAQIWRFESPLHFGNCSKLVEYINEISQQILKNNDLLNEKNNEIKICEKISENEEKENEFIQLNKIKENNNLNDLSSPLYSNNLLKNKGNLILDCSVISYIDSAGIDTLIEIYLDTKRINICIKFASFSDSILKVFNRCSLFEKIPEEFF